MRQLYSVLIFEGHAIPQVQDVTLDPTFLWVVRDIDVFFPGADFQAHINVMAASTLTTFFSSAQPIVNNPGFWAEWRGRQVFQPPSTGPTLRITNGAEFNAPDVRISGYRLSPP